MKLDQYEKEILKYVDSLEALPKLNKNVSKKYQTIAANTSKKNKRVNIRMTEHDLEAIQRKAIQEGLPYQTLISSLIHKYVTGNLKEYNRAG
jgi:predicted DNA binding CopG/RHH family protein